MQTHPNRLPTTHYWQAVIHPYYMAENAQTTEEKQANGSPSFADNAPKVTEQIKQQREGNTAEAETADAEATGASQEAASDSSQEGAAGAGAAEADASEAEAPGAGTPEAPEEASEPAGPVHRMLAEAVEAASKDVGFPSSDDTDIQVAEEKPPVTSVDTAELTQRGSDFGFTGEVQGRVVNLNDLTDADAEIHADPVYDQFRQLVEQSSSNVREQEIVMGRVLRVGEKDVVVDIGYKSDGIISKSEFGDRTLTPGDEVEVWLEYKENWDGQLVLSKLRADKERRWQRIEEVFENEEIIDGTIVRRIKGGMIAELFDGVEAFLPGSQIDVRPVRDFDAYLEKTMEFKIVKLNPGNENIVISHRALIQKELEKQREEILSQMEVGQVLQGIVKNIVDFGVFIDLGGVDGLLHITDLSWGRVSHPSELVDLDEELDVVVLDYEEERQRISLGLKQLQSHPWDDIGEKFDEGETVEGKVVSITNYGAFVELEKGIEGLVHISEMSWTRHIKHPSQMVSLGQLVDVKILNIDEEGKKISLGMKQLEPDPWEGITERYPPGTVMRGTVRNITHFGVFVEIEPGIDGLVHISDLSWTKKVRHPNEMIDRGQELDIVILNIDEERKRISLGHKQVETNPWNQFAKAYAEGSDTTGTVKRVENKGIVVELPLEVEAFVPGSELKNGPRDFQDYYQDDDELELRVIRFDQGRRDIVLSETAKDRAEDHIERQRERQERGQQRRRQQREVQQYQQGSDETTGPTTLGELSGLGDLKAQMEANEAESAAAEAEAEAAELEPEAAATDVPEGGEAQEDTDRATAEDSEGEEEIVAGAKAAQQLEGEVGQENRPQAGKRGDQGGDAGSNTEPSAETARRKEEAGDLPPAEGAQASLKGNAEVDEKEGLAATAENAVADATPGTGSTEEPVATSSSDRSAEEIESFVEASGEEAVTTDEVRAAASEGDEEPEHSFPEGFPQTARLVKAGYTSIADLRSVDNLSDIEGIGESYAEEISEALAELGEAEEQEG